jgi:hypothetical protein
MPRQLLLHEVIEQFTETRLKQQGRQRDGVRAYAWVLEKFAAFVRGYEGRSRSVRKLIRCSRGAVVVPQQPTNRSRQRT